MIQESICLNCGKKFKVDIQERTHRGNFCSLIAGNIFCHTVSVKACKDYDVWGRACSSAVNFTFVKPVVSSPVVPANIKLSK